ncbi:DUF4835 family protein [Pontibacter sp. G13]|uniref:type IX secretion system protein PorD n=1 Tax=Pontibacter sp. G13 TaxID=3074898 RepID=UPI002889C2DF|nr:DUF4835 family protein [Pontibacter sp. G13]WNJ20824.1 DUF4835 family protein [Pontibacter sp. G13]
MKKLGWIRWTILTVWMLGWGQLNAQELLCNVSVDASRISGDRSVFEDMQKVISDYMNFTKWTDDSYEAYERIRCNLQIIVMERPSPDYFTCQMNLQVFRPTYNSTYETVIANLADDRFNFNYVPYSSLIYTENSFTDNLTALLDFYAFVIVGIDHDTYLASGGNPFYRKALEINQLAASQSPEAGWKSNESQRNRYWLSENLTNNRYSAFHAAMYKYHRQGLDLMESDPGRGRKGILAALKDMKNLTLQNPLLILSRNFLDAKRKELIKVFENGFANDKKEFVAIMQELDAQNMGDYNKIMNN